MQCPNCGGMFEYAGGGQHARCTRCLAMFSNENGQLTPIIVQAPGGGNNPEFNAIFAQNLGFGPPPPQQDVARGNFDLGGGVHLKVKINGQTPENYAKNKASQMIWGWIIGAIIIAILVITFAGIGGYAYYMSKHSMDAPSAAGGGGSTGGGVGGWDGKSTFECKGNDVVSLAGVTANVSGTAIKASANCKLSLTGVNITAPVGIEASAAAQVNITGGSINSTTTPISAANAAKVSCVGTKITGKNKTANAGKIEHCGT